MAGHTVLLHLFGGVALLLWGTRMVQEAVLKGFGPELRGALGRAAAGPVRAAATGAATATLLQSATATATLLAGFLSRGLIALPAALAVLLGADLGSAVAVQALSVDLGALPPLLLVAGVALARLGGRPRAAEAGKALVGLGLALLALRLIGAATAPMRESDVTALALARLAHDPLLAAILAAVLTWAMHSSVAFVLFVVSLSAGGLIALPLALALVIGANVGAGLVALGLALRAPAAARRALYGNLGFRVVGATAAFLALGPIAGAMARLGDDPGRLAAHFHLLFNLGLAVAFLPLAGRAATLLEAAFPDAAAAPATPKRLDHLDPALLDRPALALNAATRAILQLADKVETMLRESLATFEEEDGARRIAAVEALEDEVDDDQEEIKLYLARLMQRELRPEESDRVLEAILFTTNLEHIGDIIDKGLLPLAAKRRKRGLSFSPEGWRDIRAFHAHIAEQMRRAVAVYIGRDPAEARELVAQKDRLREEEAAATERHIDRLRAARPETVETSALHLDVLRDLKRVNAHLTTVAYPILEQTGELRGSRLRAPQPAASAPKPRGKRAQA